MREVGRLEACNDDDFGPSDLHARVEHRSFHVRNSETWSYQLGGPGTSVVVNAGFPQQLGYPGSAGEPDELTFAILKVVGGPSPSPAARSIVPAGTSFVAGDYHYWVEDFGEGTGRPPFEGSDAQVSVTTTSAHGGSTVDATFAVDVVPGPAKVLWRVVDLTIDADGNVTPTVVQQFVAGNTETRL